MKVLLYILLTFMAGALILTTLFFALGAAIAFAFGNYTGAIMAFLIALASIVANILLISIMREEEK